MSDAPDPGTTACWYVECPVRIPRRREFVPQHDGTYLERFITDEAAVLAHLSEKHPIKDRPASRFRRIVT